MTTPATDRPPSMWEDLLEVFYAPTAVFQRRRETPAFGLALVLLVIIAVILTIVFKTVNEPIMDAEASRGMAAAMKQNPQMTEEQVNQGKKFFGNFAPIIVGVYFLIAPLLVGLCLWLVGKLVESKAQLGQMMMVATYAMFPRLLEAIVNSVQVLLLPEHLITGRFSVTLGVGRFLNPDTQQVLISILGRVDLFTLWVTFICAVGLAVMGKITMGRAAVAATIVWALGALFPLIGALRAT